MTRKIRRTEFLHDGKFREGCIQSRLGMHPPS